MRLSKTEKRQSPLLKMGPPVRSKLANFTVCAGKTEAVSAVLPDRDAKFTNVVWIELLGETFAEIRKLGERKGGEYAGDGDRLANFRRNALALGVSMEMVWAVYAAKHWDAIQQFVKDTQAGKTRVRSEPIEGRVDDLLTYLLLFKAILKERGSA
jgi:hypothetical protein